MGMNADELRATGTGDWLAQLKTILQLGADDERDYGKKPKAEHRSTKTAVKVLLSNLRQGVKKTPDGNTTEDDKKMIVFNAVDQLIRDKVNKSKSTPRKTTLEAVAMFEDVLKQEFAAKANTKDEVSDSWQKLMRDAVQALRSEALDKINDQNALEIELDKLLPNKDQKSIAKVLEDKDNNEPHKLLEHCVRKMLASDEGKKAIESSTARSMNAIKSVRDPKLGFDLLTSIDAIALDGPEFGKYAKSLGDDKDEILSKAMVANLKKPLPTNPSEKQFAASSQASSFAAMAKEMDPAEFAKLAKTLLKSKEGKQLLVDNPKLGGALLSSIDPAALKDFDFETTFGPAKEDILVEAIHMLSVKSSSSGNGNANPPAALDPKLFKLLATKVDPKIWNDKTATTPSRKGLGTRVGMELWNAGGYEQICDLIAHGVDTSLPTRLTFNQPEWKEGTHSGFVEPMQHIVAKYLRDVGKLEKDGNSLTGDAKTKAEGAQKVFAALAAKEKEDKENKVESTVKGITSWSELQKSEWMKAFNEKPGTIWGFEHVRMPYVQAGHDHKKGSRPLRMWELWDALGPDQKTYEELLKNPKVYTKAKVEEAATKIKNKESTRIDYEDIKDLDAFVEEFKKQATKVLLEFAAQMPKGTFADSAGTAGFQEGKFLGGLACKAGLWWAKEQKEPVYYCLDGIDMNDVTNYKKLKSTAIDDYLSGRIKRKHDEVITMVEIREILKNWDDLKFTNKKGQEEDVVKFVWKGKILSGDDLQKKLKEWQDEMKQVNEAHPTPAPDYKTFTDRLNKIDTGLLAQLGKETDAKKANREAREIVKRHGYFVKLARTKPHIALKYIMYKCDTLITYGLISEDLPDAATALKDALDAKDNKKIKTAAGDVDSEIENCHKDYRAPLKKALLRHPVTLKPLLEAEKKQAS
jgi:hypothetical protein